MSIKDEVIDNLDEILNEKGDPSVLVDSAEKLGKELSAVSNSQIRNLFHTVKIMREYDKEKLELLRPKLAYVRGRKGDKIAPLEEVLQNAIIKVDDENMFQRFKDFFEAIVAYHRRYGEKN